jgi:hypothetical protein
MNRVNASVHYAAPDWPRGCNGQVAILFARDAGMSHIAHSFRVLLLICNI